MQNGKTKVVTYQLEILPPTELFNYKETISGLIHIDRQSQLPDCGVLEEAGTPGENPHTVEMGRTIILQLNPQPF